MSQATKAVKNVAARSRKGKKMFPTILRNELAKLAGKPTLVYIHVGKCGGASLRRAIKSSDKIRSSFSSVKKVHIRKPPIKGRCQYIVVVRNPVSRCISAFNWRYKIVVEDGRQQDRFPGEHDVLKKYGDLNSLAEALYHDDSLYLPTVRDWMKIHHLYEDISFYLHDLLLEIESKNLFAVLAQENLDQDIERLLGVTETQKVHENSSSTKRAKLELSARARANLKRFLAADYDAIAKLHEMQPFEAEVFDSLMV